MSKRKRSPFEHQRNSFSGVSSQVNNFATRGSAAGNNITIVEELGGGGSIINGYRIDPRYSRYRTMHARNGQCILDGRTCVLKEVDGVKMWTLEGVPGAPLPSTVIENENSGSSDSSSSSSTSFDDRVYRKWRREKRVRKERKKDKNEAEKRRGADVKVQEFLAVLSAEQVDDASKRKRELERIKLIGELD